MHISEQEVRTLQQETQQQSLYVVSRSEQQLQLGGYLLQLAHQKPHA